MQMVLQAPVAGQIQMVLAIGAGNQIFLRYHLVRTETPPQLVVLCPDFNRSSDPFIHMERTNKTYGFTIAVKELKETVPNLFRYASAYKRLHNLPTTGLWKMFSESSDPPKAAEQDLPEDVVSSQPAGRLPDIDPENMEGEKYKYVGNHSDNETTGANCCLSMCHFWSNFEIARLDFFRSKEYEDFFQMMDKSGGFWTERVSRALCFRFPNRC